MDLQIERQLNVMTLQLSTGIDKLRKYMNSKCNSISEEDDDYDNNVINNYFPIKNKENLYVVEQKLIQDKSFAEEFSTEYFFFFFK